MQDEERCGARHETLGKCVRTKDHTDEPVNGIPKVLHWNGLSLNASIEQGKDRYWVDGKVYQAFEE